MYNTELYRAMHDELDIEQEAFKLEQEGPHHLPSTQVITESMAMSGGQIGAYYRLRKNEGLIGKGGAILAIPATAVCDPLIVPDTHVGMTRSLDVGRLAGMLVTSLSEMNKSLGGMFEEINLYMHRIKFAWDVARPTGHLLNHAPVFLDSGAYWREKKNVHAIVIPRNQSRKDLAKNSNRRNHTQRRNLKRDILNAIKRK